MKPLFLAVPLPIAPAGGNGEDANALCTAIRTVARPLYNGVVFAGRGALRHPALPALLATAREAGFRYRQVDTAAEPAAAPGAAAVLRDGGANLVLVTLPAPPFVPARGRTLQALRGLRAILSLPASHVGVRIVLPEPDADAARAAEHAVLALPSLGVRHLFLVPRRPIEGPDGTPTPPPPAVADAVARALRVVPGELRTVGWGAGHLLVGDEAERPPFAFARDGDPFVFRRSRATAPDGPAVLLLHTPRYRARSDRTLFPPLGLARLAAATRQHGYRTTIRDINAAVAADPDATALLADPRQPAALRETGALPPALAALFERLLPPALVRAHAVVGIDVLDPFETYQVDLAASLASWLRSVHPTATLVAGGDSVELHRLRAAPAAVHALFDLIVDGQGELALVGLLNRLEYADRPRSAVHNVVGGAVNLGVRQTREVYEWPFIEVRRHRLPRPDFRDVDGGAYAQGPSPVLAAFFERRATAGHRPAVPVDLRVATLPFQMITGCNAHCVFCNYPRHMDVLPPERAARDLVAAADQTGVRQFYLLDPTLNLTPRFLHRFADELIRLDGDLLWFDSARPTGIDETLARKLRAAGCVLLTFGVDGGANPLLERMKKGFTIDDVERTVAATAAAGIVNRFNLIVGFPYETDEDVDETIAFVRRNADNLHVLGCYNPFYLNVAMPLEERGVPIVRRGTEECIGGSLTQAWDEPGHRSWPEKRVATERDMARILAAVRDAGICGTDISEHDILLLHRAGAPFDDIRAYLSFVAAEAGERPRVEDLGWQG